MLQVTGHLTHAGAVSGRLFAADRKDAGVLGAEMAMRTDRDFAEIGEIAGFHKEASDAQEFQRFATKGFTHTQFQ